MNTNMYENPVTQDNLDILRRYGWESLLPPAAVCLRRRGGGQDAEPEDLLQHVLRHPGHAPGPWRA